MQGWQGPPNRCPIAHPLEDDDVYNQAIRPHHLDCTCSCGVASHETQQGCLFAALLDDREPGVGGHDLQGQMLAHPARLTLGAYQQANAPTEAQLPTASELMPFASKGMTQHSGAEVGGAPGTEPPFMPKLGGNGFLHDLCQNGYEQV